MSELTAFEKAMASGEMDDEYIVEYMCPKCRWNTGNLARQAFDVCEGEYCSEIFDGLCQEDQCND